jgi:integrase
MTSKTPTGKASKGSVTLLVSNGRLQLRFSFAGKRQYLSTGYPDTPTYRKLAEIKAAEIEKDILYERFDPSDLSKYRTQTQAQQVTPVTPSEESVSLVMLWDKYMDFKRPSLSPSTIANDFVRVRNCLSGLPKQSVDDAVGIRDWLVANKSANATKRLLTQLSACCSWAVKSKMIDRNPFLGMASDVKLPKSEMEDTDINPFSTQERDQIVMAFQGDRYYSRYAPLIEFLFMTGCRPSEAVALQWKHVTEDFSTLRFEQAVVISEHGLVCKKGLKTQKKRSFPVNAKLGALLRSIKPKDANGETRIFPSPEGLWIDVHNLTNRAWKSILQKLDDVEYRKLYQTRHTFITLALETPIKLADGRVKMLDAKDVAALVGNSPKMIYEHYAGKAKDLFVPEF